MRIKAIIVIVFIAVIDLLPHLLLARSKNDLKTIDSGYAEVNKTKLYYEIAGKGEPLVLIHGSFGDHRHWDLQFTELSKKYKVLRYDLRGFGRSALPNADEVYRDADDLNALMEFLGIKKAHICGLSFGSFVVFDFALSHPDKCISLISIGPRVAGDDQEEYKTPNTDTLKVVVSKAIDIVKNKGSKEAIDFLWAGDNCFSKSIRSQRTRESLLKMGYEYSWWRYLHANKREYAFPMAIKKLNEIKTPTLVVTAEYDLELCKHVAAILSKGIPGAKFISLRGAGHIMNMDKPKEFNKAITEFIDKVNRRPLRTV